MIGDVTKDLKKVFYLGGGGIGYVVGDSSCMGRPDSD